MGNTKPKYGEIIQETNTFTDEAESILKEGLSEFTEEFKATK